MNSLERFVKYSKIVDKIYPSTRIYLNPADFSGGKYWLIVRDVAKLSENLYSFRPPMFPNKIITFISKIDCRGAVAILFYIEGDKFIAMEVV